jgi:hypothetical protein
LFGVRGSAIVSEFCKAELVTLLELALGSHTFEIVMPGSILKG